MQMIIRAAITLRMKCSVARFTAAQTAPSELAQDSSRRSHIHPEHFAPAVSVDAHRYDHRSETMRQRSPTFT